MRLVIRPRISHTIIHQRLDKLVNSPARVVIVALVHDVEYILHLVLIDHECAYEIELGLLNTLLCNGALCVRHLVGNLRSQVKKMHGSR